MLKQLPKAPVEGLVKTLLQFLGPGAQAHSDYPAGAAIFIGATQAQRCFEAVSRAQPLLEAHVATALELPFTLNHGQLQPEHAVLTAAGQCLLINWTRAVSGPAGLSLHSLLGAHKPFALSAARHSGALACDLDDSPVDVLLSHYIKTLAQGGYADEPTLSRCLPASMTIGLLLDVLFLAQCVMDDPDEAQIVGQRMLVQLNLLVELCDGLSAAKDALC